jgi:FkbM family methyltransferase
MIRNFCNIKRAKQKEFELEFFGLTYHGSLDCYLDWCVYFFGAYEKYELFLLRDMVKNRTDAIFIDVGANIGQHSLFMSKYCKQVHSFEPYVVVREKLEQKIQVNNIENIIIHPFGLGKENEELEFFAPQGGNTGTGSFLSSHATGNNKSVGRLKLLNGDEYIDRLRLRKVDLIKIDVEGFEKNVLIGLRKTLEIYRPIIFLEFSGDTRDSLTCFDDLRSLVPKGYKFGFISTNRQSYGIFNTPDYEIRDFDFDTSEGNLLLMP